MLLINEDYKKYQLSQHVITHQYSCPLKTESMILYRDHSFVDPTFFNRVERGLLSELFCGETFQKLILLNLK